MSEHDTVRIPRQTVTVDLGPRRLNRWDHTGNYPDVPLGVALVPLDASDGETWTPVRRTADGLYVVRSSTGRVFKAHPSEVWYLPPA